MTPSGPRPFSIHIYLPDGTPDGIRIISKSNWTGCGIVCPRALLPEARKRDEFSGTGVYLLEGPPDQSELPSLYIGQGDCIRTRLDQHQSGKDFWTRAVFFVSKDGSLNRAHFLYLEAHLIELALEAKRVRLENQTVPSHPKLSEPDTADVKSFLEDMLSILPLVGITGFEKPKAARRKKDLLHATGKGATATGYEAPEGFVVLKDSLFRLDEVSSIHAYMSAIRRDLENQGVLVRTEDAFVLAQDYIFNSPSTAAGVVLGRTANGRIEWKDDGGRTLKEIQEASVPPEAVDA
jgi:hypothetical protein